MSASAASQLDSFGVYYAKRAVLAAKAPPYSDYEEISPNCTFGMLRWPFAWWPSGNKSGATLNFLQRTRINGKYRSLRKNRDAILLLQAREAAYAHLYFKHLLTVDWIENNTVEEDDEPDVGDVEPRRRLPKARSVVKAGRLLLRLLIGIRELGLTSLSELRPAHIRPLFASFRCPPSVHNELARHFENLVILSKAGLLTDPLGNHRFHVEEKVVIPDTSKGSGKQPLPDLMLAHMIETAMFYIDRRDKICWVLGRLRDGHIDTHAARDWARACTRGEIAPTGQIASYLITCLQVSAYFLIELHLGARISETLSLRKGCLGLHEGKQVLHTDKATLKATTYKNVAKLYGEQRYFLVHPYLHEAVQALELIKETMGCPGEFLFSKPGSTEEYTVNVFYGRLRVFCSRHGFDICPTGHVWRKTLISLATRSLEDGLPAVSYILGHKWFGETMGYVMSMPFLLRQLRDATKKAAKRAAARLVDETKALGGPGLAGRQGRKLEQAAEARYNIHVAEMEPDDARALTRHEIASEVVAAGAIPVPMGNGRQCTKPPMEIGMCGRRTKDLVSDGEGCDSKCGFLAETWTACDEVTSRISVIPTELSHRKPALAKLLWARKLIEDALLWPQSSSLLKTYLTERPEFAQWFPTDLRIAIGLAA